MWLQKWLWERYKELRLRIGIRVNFTLKEAKEILDSDSDQTVYKLLNELERLKIIKTEKAKEDKRVKKYKIVLDLKDIPYAYTSFPSKYTAGQRFLAGSMPVQGAQIFSASSPSKIFGKLYSKESEQQVTLVPEKEAETIEAHLVKLIQEYKSAEAILSVIKKYKVDFEKVINELNSYQKRYLGALLEILNEHKEIRDKIYDLTKKDMRGFSIFPRKVRKVPKDYIRLAKTWRINLNIDVVNLDEL